MAAGGRNGERGDVVFMVLAFLVFVFVDAYKCDPRKWRPWGKIMDSLCFPET
jgi:hypothetical protein